MTTPVPRPRPELIVMGASAGGLKALEIVLGGLPPGFPIPIVAVQHRARASGDTFAEGLGKGTTIPVREVEDDVPLAGPRIYLAPPDYHVLIEPGRCALSIDDPVSYSRPSIDVLFESAADVYAGRIIAVLMTGANADGAKGLARVKEVGGYAIVQDPLTAES